MRGLIGYLPGHRGIWEEPLRTGKYAINPRCYEAERVPTAILSLNWSEAVSQAHKLDERLSGAGWLERFRAQAAGARAIQF